MPDLLAFERAAQELRQDKPHLNTRPIRIRGLLPGDTCLSFLARRIPLGNPDAWTEALVAGELALDGQVLTQDIILKSSSRLTHTRIEPPEPDINTNLSIIYEDKDLFVIDKPPNLPVHPCGRYHYHSFSVIAKQAWPELTLRPVHRLDTATSGLLVLAKTTQAAQHLTRQFEARTVKKIYRAKVHPVPSWNFIVCYDPIGTGKYASGSRSVDLAGQPAETRFTHLGDGVVEAEPITGRTNQIRVHLNQLKHPIIGDWLYGGAASNRLHLHSFQIEFQHPCTQKLMQLRTD